MQTLESERLFENDTLIYMKYKNTSPASNVIYRWRNHVVLLIFVLFYIGFGVYLTRNQEKVVYQPWPQDFYNCPAFVGADMITYEGTRMYVRKGEAGTVVLYHGNAGSACDRAYLAQLFVDAGYGYVVPEYAGYSNDPRMPTHNLVKADVTQVVSYIETHTARPLLIVGESVGTGVASYHTSLQMPDRLLLISPFASLYDIARKQFWYYPTSLLVDNAFDNVALLTHYEGSVTIIHGDIDRVIPQASGRTLFDALTTSNKQFVSVEGKGHNDLWTSEDYVEVIKNFLAK